MSRWQSAGLAGILLVSLQSNALGDETAHREAVQRLFELTDMQEKIDESVANVLALQLAQNPPLREHEAVLREFLERSIGWDSLVEPLTEMYLQEFTEEELDEMNAFYSSPTGRKVIERLPALVQRRNQLASRRLQENVGELQQAIEANQKQQAQP